MYTFILGIEAYDSSNYQDYVQSPVNSISVKFAEPVVLRATRCLDWWYQRRAPKLKEQLQELAELAASAIADVYVLFQCVIYNELFVGRTFKLRTMLRIGLIKRHSVAVGVGPTCRSICIPLLNVYYNY